MSGCASLLSQCCLNSPLLLNLVLGQRRHLISEIDPHALSACVAMRSTWYPVLRSFGMSKHSCCTSSCPCPHAVPSMHCMISSTLPSTTAHPCWRLGPNRDWWWILCKCGIARLSVPHPGSLGLLLVFCFGTLVTDLWRVLGAGHAASKILFGLSPLTRFWGCISWLFITTTPSPWDSSWWRLPRAMMVDVFCEAGMGQSTHPIG